MHLRLLSLFALGILLALPATAQERANEEVRASPNAAVAQTIGMTDVMVTYGRPSVRDRDIFGDLVPYDAIWRTGANEATTISFSDDVMIEGESLAAGTYSLYTIPGEDEWTVIFNSVAEQWGAYDYDEGNDVLRVMASPEASAFSELMTFSFDTVNDNEGTLVLHWDETAVPLTISAGS